jgi:hypothetical protein
VEGREYLSYICLTQLSNREREGRGSKSKIGFGGKGDEFLKF